MTSRLPFAALILLLVLASAAAQQPSAPAPQQGSAQAVQQPSATPTAAQQPALTPAALAGKPISRDTRFEIIRALNAEFATARKPFPLGTEGLIIKADGKLKPDDAGLRSLLLKNGPAAQLGERVRITNVEFKGENKIVFEINGGPVKKKKWYQRLSIGGAGGMTPVATAPDELARGSFVVLEFKDQVPEITAAQVKELLAPVLDFRFKSPMEAYLDSIPPKAAEAIKNKQVLVGMDRRMVQESLGRPPRKIRERDEQGREYEEWIYGEPPQDVQFVRFVGDEVVQLKIMRIDGEKIVRTEKEVDLSGVQPPEQASTPEPSPANKPTLRRPGEAPDVAAPPPPPNPPTSNPARGGR